MRLGGDLVVIVEQKRCESLAHMPLDVIGEHAEKDVGTDPIDQVMVDGADLEVNGLVAAKRPLDVAEVFLGTHRLLGVKHSALRLVRTTWGTPRSRAASCGNFPFITRIGKAGRADVETKVLRHLEAMEHLPDA